MKAQNAELIERRRRFEEAFSNDTYFAGIGLDKEVHRQYLLSMISFFAGGNRDLQECIDLKHLINSNPDKVQVLKQLLGDLSPELPQTVDKTGTDEETQDEELLQSTVESRQQENSRLDAELGSILTRNLTIDKEIKKNRDFVTVKASEGLDRKQADLQRQVEEIREEISMFSS